jgi:Ala-tRNA(Pro) deacylase
VSIPAHIRQYLDEHQVRYEHITHAPHYTAQGAARAVRAPGKEFAKTVILTDDLGYVMAVLPANRRISLDALHEITGRRGLRIATELEFQGLFPNCETGAMAPFGNLYEIPVFVDASLREDESITFHAGTHQDAIRMPYPLYEKLVAPVVGSFGELAGGP